MDPAEILGPTGSIARRLSNYEHRPQQLEMARAVAAALRDKQHLIAEAGTGTGKSFAYLVPAILHATADQVETPRNEDADAPAEKKPRPPAIIVSTHTISLQEQLLLKDIPLLRSVIPREFSAVLGKGRGNYLSLRRLDRAWSRSATLMANDEQIHQLRHLVNWSKETTGGSLSDLPFRPRSDVWEEVVSDSGNCLGRECKTHKDCFYYAARRRLQNAQLIIVNHALFFTDLQLRAAGASLLPNYSAVIFDEAHTLEQVAGDHLGLRFSNAQVEHVLARLYNDQTQRGLLVQYDLKALQQEVDRCRIEAGDLFADVANWHQGRQPSNGRVAAAEQFKSDLAERFHELAGKLERYRDSLEGLAERKEFSAAADRLKALGGSWSEWNQQKIPEAVYWVEVTQNRRGQQRVELAAAPIDVGSQLRDLMFKQIPSVILTSATLATGREADFTFFRRRVGLRKSPELRVGSPFDYRRQSTVVLMEGMPDPSQQKHAYEQLVPELVKRFIERTGGYAFALFTSYDSLRRCAENLRPWLNQRDLELYSQAGQLNRTQMLQAFKENPRGVLLGTDSFWQGVDVPGDALRMVIITKLPFSVPDHPLLESRLEAIRHGGGNPFRDYQLPEAVIKFRQGFGRLIRTATDTGQVVVLDPRIHTKAYGRIFLESLPDCAVTRERL